MEKNRISPNIFFPSYVLLGLMVTQNTGLLFLLYSRYVSCVVLTFGCNPCLLMCRWYIVLFMDLSRFFLIKPSVCPGYDLRKTCFNSLRRLVFFGINSASWQYLASSGLVVWSIIFCTVAFFPPWLGLSVVEPPTFLYDFYIYSWFFFVIMVFHSLFVRWYGTSIIT